jgi:hypothetical protein
MVKGGCEKLELSSALVDCPCSVTVSSDVFKGTDACVC